MVIRCGSWVPRILVVVPLALAAGTGCGGSKIREEISFRSGSLTIVGDLVRPEGKGPFPVVLFVHGDGPNNRTSGVTYPPIMARMHAAGYATFAWDKPGTGESKGQIDRSRLLEQRARIVLDAIAAVADRSDIDPERVGLWGISQAGFVMPRVLAMTDKVAFVIAVSCAGTAGVNQGAYLVTRQAVCAGLSEADAVRVEALLAAVEVAPSYQEYVRLKQELSTFPELGSIAELGFNVQPVPPARWHLHDAANDYFWDPMDVIARTSVPVLAVFGDRDTQVDPRQGARAYEDALARAGNPYSRVALIPGADHNILVSSTGCLSEREARTRSGWQNYAPPYLDLIEEWLRGLR